MTIAPLPPPPPPPASLEDFLGRYTSHARVGGIACPAAGRFAAELVRAAARGDDLPSPTEAGLSGEDTAAVDDLLAEMFSRTREFPSATSLVFGVLREYRARVEIIPPHHSPGEPRGLMPRPVARERPRPGPVFRPAIGADGPPPAVVARQLQELAASGEAAALFLHALAAAVGRGSGGPGQTDGADTTSLDDAGREAVGALLEAGMRTMRVQGKRDLAAGLSQVLGEWQVWVRTPQPHSKAQAAMTEAERA